MAPPTDVAVFAYSDAAGVSRRCDLCLRSFALVGPGAPRRERRFQHRNLSRVFRTSRRPLADDDSFERQHTDAHTVDVVPAGLAELLIEGLESRCGQHDVHAIEAFAAESWRLHTEPRCVQTAGSSRGLVQSIPVDPSKPEIEILRRARRALDQRGRHPHDEVPDPQGVKRLEQGSLSGRENEFEHG